MRLTLVNTMYWQSLENYTLPVFTKTVSEVILWLKSGMNPGIETEKRNDSME